MRHIRLQSNKGRLSSWLKGCLALGTGMAILMPGLALAGGGFQVPSRGAPASTTDGGTRQALVELGMQFTPSRRGAPESTSEGGTRRGFDPSRRGAPQSTSEGGTRGDGTLSTQRRGAPVTTTEGGTRAPLSEMDVVTLLVPHQGLPMTLESHPEFFAYIPDIPVQSVKFTLYRHDPNRGVDEELVYEVEMPAPSQAGILKFELPAGEQYALQPGELYHWYVSLAVGADEDNSDNFALDSWVERLAPGDEIAQQLAKLNPQVSANVYAEAGIWHDALSYALARREASSALTPQACLDNEAADIWGSLLQSVNLCHVVSAPVLN